MQPVRDTRTWTVGGESQDLFIPVPSPPDYGVGSGCVLFSAATAPVVWLFSLCYSFHHIPRTASSPQPFRLDGGDSFEKLSVPWWFNSTSIISHEVCGTNHLQWHQWETNTTLLEKGDCENTHTEPRMPLNFKDESSSLGSTKPSSLDLKKSQRKPLFLHHQKWEPKAPDAVSKGYDLRVASARWDILALEGKNSHPSLLYLRSINIHDKPWEQQKNSITLICKYQGRGLSDMKNIKRTV